MDIKIGDYVKYVEQLYSDIQTQNITTSNFITSFKDRIRDRKVGKKCIMLSLDGT